MEIEPRTGNNTTRRVQCGSKRRTARAVTQRPRSNHSRRRMKSSVLEYIGRPIIHVNYSRFATGRSSLNRENSELGDGDVEIRGLRRRIVNW